MIYKILSIINCVTALKYIYKISKKIGFYGKIIRKNKINNLILFNSKNKNLDVLFISHIDTVNEGNMKNWSSFPYSKKVIKNRIISRGAVDMKGAIISLFNILNKEMQKNIAIIISGDEEGVAKYGSRIISKYLKNNNYKIKLSLIGEPTSKKKIGDTCKNGRRGSCNIIIKIKGKQGHTAFSNGVNPLENFNLSKIIKKGININVSIIGIISNNLIFNVTPETLKIFINIRFSSIKFLNLFFKKIIKIIKKTNLKTKIKKISIAKPFCSKINLSIIKKIKKKIKIEKFTGGTSDGRFFQFSKYILEIGLKNKYIHKTNERCKINDIKKLSKIYKKIIY